VGLSDWSFSKVAKMMNEPRRHRKPIQPIETEKDHNDRWLLTYADMITLLLGLFIVMYSISTVDVGKLKTVASVIRGGFGLDEGGESLVYDGQSGVIQDKDLIPKSQIYRLWEKLAYTIKKVFVTEKVLIELHNKEELTLTIPASSLGDGKIHLPEETSHLFQNLYDMNKEVSLEIIIRVQIPYLDGLSHDQFQSNWDFTAHRASLIAKHLSKKYNIPESNILVQGVSNFQSLSNKDPDTLEGLANQERVEILIRKKEIHVEK
jgi:chemotaxis protein MotB